MTSSKEYLLLLADVPTFNGRQIVSSKGAWLPTQQMST